MPPFGVLWAAGRTHPFRTTAILALACSGNGDGLISRYSVAWQAAR